MFSFRGRPPTPETGASALYRPFPVSDTIWIIPVLPTSSIVLALPLVTGL